MEGGGGGSGRNATAATSTATAGRRVRSTGRDGGLNLLLVVRPRARNNASRYPTNSQRLDGAGKDREEAGTGNKVRCHAKFTGTQDGSARDEGIPLVPRPPQRGGQRWRKRQHRAATQSHRQSSDPKRSPDVV